MVIFKEVSFWAEATAQKATIKKPIANNFTTAVLVDVSMVRLKFWFIGLLLVKVTFSTILI